MTAPAAEVADRQMRVEGRARTGVVTLRDFDQGVVETMGGVVFVRSGSTWVQRDKKLAEAPSAEDNYFLVLSTIDGAPDAPGVPITFSNPEDLYERYRLPAILVRRDDIEPAMARFHPGAIQYRVPASSAHAAVVTLPDGTTVHGHDGFEELPQAQQFDITYTIEVSGRHRGSKGIRNQANAVFMAILKKYPPYCRVLLTDSIGDQRSYEAFMESTSVLDELMDVADRKIGFSLTLRIEAELDLADPINRMAVTSTATVQSSLL